ncbi:MAG: hypothetical protein IJF18_01250 [Oscillospiraceae bacterium]|nr:hypothetical protein [Oscillospiraceae bacterium]
MNTETKKAGTSSKKNLTAMEEYLNSVYKLIILVFPGACQCAGLLYTFEKIMGWMPSVSWPALIIFDITCLIYLAVGFLLVKTGFNKDGLLKPGRLKAGKIYIVIIEIIQFNFILYMIPATDFWGFAFFFVVLASFFHDWKLTAVISAEIAGSLVVSWFIHGEITLPAQNEFFIPNLLDRIVCVALSLPTLVFLAFITNRFLVNAKKDELERNNARVQNVLATAQGLSENLLNAGGALSDISENENASAASLSSTSESLLLNSNALSQKADLSIANLNELKDCGEALNENVEKVEFTSKNLMQKSEDNEQALNALREINEEVIDSMNSTNEVAAKLSEAVQGIDATLQLISEIAMTTNILSINATIEAARAGEAGRSFAVVASEVGGLANSTQSSLNDIQAVVSRVQENVEEMIKYVAGNSEKLTLQSKHFAEVFDNMQEMNSLLRQSMNDISTMNEVYDRQNDIIRRTFDINEDIAENIRKENREFTSISEMVEKNAENMANMTEQVTSINQMAAQIDELLNNN